MATRDKGIPRAVLEKKSPSCDLLRLNRKTCVKYRVSYRSTQANPEEKFEALRA
jgi:hypothetical protein